MSLMHDIIKMKFIREGYLPNYPYHMISDKEMCDAFLQKTSESQPNELTGYFSDTYPCLHDKLAERYNCLVDDILLHLNRLKSSNSDSYILPNWIYSYMLGSVIGPKSSTSDIHDLLVLLNEDNIDDVFTYRASEACYNISSRWLKKPSDDIEIRSATMFGEPHVIKSLRLTQVDVI